MEASKYVLPRYNFIRKRIGKNTTEEVMVLYFTQKKIIVLQWEMFLSITDSDLNCEKLIIILKSLLDNPVLQVLELSKCKIGDKGMVALCKFILENSVKEINLNNNRIG